MGKKLLVALAVFGVLCLLGGAAAVGYLALHTLKPDLVDKGLQKEMGIAGLTMGASTEQDLLAKYGEPDERKDETLNHVYVYEERGLLFRIDRASGKLEWVQVTGPDVATAKGIKVGATYDQILDAYGPTNSVALLPTGTRVRYKYGMAYVLEFMLDQSRHITKISFYKV
jgi:hypothetical protein